MTKNLPNWLQNRAKVDATKPCTINVLPGDIKGATPRNGAKCVAARCAKRAFGAKHVYVFRTSCYVEFDETQPAERFIPSRRLFKDVIEPLDAGRFENIKPGRYDLLPPAKSLRLGQAVKRRKALAARRKAGLAGPSTKRRKYKARPVVGRIHSA